MLEKYFNVMIETILNHHLLQYFLIELNMNMTHEGHNIVYPIIAIHMIYHHLISTNAPTQFLIKLTKNYKHNILQLFTDGISHEDQQHINDNNTMITITYLLMFCKLVKMNSSSNDIISNYMPSITIPATNQN